MLTPQRSRMARQGPRHSDARKRLRPRQSSTVARREPKKESRSVNFFALFWCVVSMTSTPYCRKKKGSSRITGERGADLEEEVFVVAVPVSPTLDDLDGVVNAFDDAGIERMAAASHDSVPVALQALGELL